MKVYQAINAVQADIAKVGIAKLRRNPQQGYQFRGIDDVFDALAPLLAKHGLVILPRVVDHQQVERKTAKGGTLIYTIIKCDFDFVAAEDGSKHTVTTIGEAMDSGDKSANKSMSAAYKYAALQTFAIPTEGDNDADGSSHEALAELDQIVVDGMRDAAMQGSEALKRAFKNNTKTPGFPDWWAVNSKSLKVAAKEADDAAAGD